MGEEKASIIVTEAFTEQFNLLLRYVFHFLPERNCNLSFKVKKKTTANIQRNIGLLGTIGDASENQEWRSQSTEWKEQAYKLTT